jgi:hypothetical protein
MNPKGIDSKITPPVNLKQQILNGLQQNGPISTNPRPTTPQAISKLPTMDQVILDYPLDLEEGSNEFEKIYQSYINPNSGLDAIDRDLLDLQINNGFYFDGSQNRDFELTKQIYNKHKTSLDETKRKSPFYISHYTHKQLSAIEEFFGKMNQGEPSRNKAQEYSQFLTLFKNLKTGDFSLDINDQDYETYSKFFEDQINKLKKNPLTNDQEKNEFRMRQITIENYYFMNLLPKELMKFGILYNQVYNVPSAKIKRSRNLGIISPKLNPLILTNLESYKNLKDEYKIPVNIFNSANGVLDRRIATLHFKQGNININQLGLEGEVAYHIAVNKLWKNRFDNAFKTEPDFKFERDPRFLDQFLHLAFHHNKELKADSIRGRILEENLSEARYIALIRMYLDSQIRQQIFQDTNHYNDEQDFWSQINIMRQEMTNTLFKEKSNSQLANIQREIKKAVGTDGLTMKAEDVDSSNIQREITQIMNIEARLRAISQSKNPVYLLNKALAYVVIPIQQETSEHHPKSKSVKGRYGTEITLTKFFTEKLLKNGKELSKDIQWDKLLIEDFSSFDKYAYENYLKNPLNPKSDPYGLMKLRQAWYKYFDEKFGGADFNNKFNTAQKDSSIQEAAKSIIKREFTSLEDRKIKDHVTYYQKHLGASLAA